jgi:DNA-binding SARP family transcriptional activator
MAIAVDELVDRSHESLTSAPTLELRVLGGFGLRAHGRSVGVSANVERVLAFLAVRARPQLRTAISTMLWMDTTEDRAGANLRTALWKARQTDGGWIVSTGNYVSLAPEVRIDIATVVAQARRLIGTDTELLDSDTYIESLCVDLLPDWDEDWIVFERERLRQLRMHALEALCRRLTAVGRMAEAVDAGLAAVAAEPLRESAQRALITAHLAEGNIHEARRQYALYRGLLYESLGEQPSEQLRVLVIAPHETGSRATADPVVMAR